MSKSLNELQSEGLIEPFASSSQQIIDKMDIAKRDLRNSKKIISDPDLAETTHNTAYNAMLQAGTALMYNMGYRPKRGRDNHHMVVVIFIKNIYSGQIPNNVIIAFNNGRNSRNKSQYDISSSQM